MDDNSKLSESRSKPSTAQRVRRALVSSRPGSSFRPSKGAQTPKILDSLNSSRNDISMDMSDGGDSPNHRENGSPHGGFSSNTPNILGINSNSGFSKFGLLRNLRKRNIEALAEDELLDIAIEVLKKAPSTRRREEVKVLVEAMKSVEFFRHLDDDSTQECMKHMYHVSKAAKDSVFEIDTPGTTFWVTLRGSVGVWLYNEKVEDFSINRKRPMNEVKVLTKGAAFGELALLENKNRAATIICKEDCDFAVLDKKHFMNILKESEIRRLYKEVDFLVAIPIFQGWDFRSIKSVYLNSACVNFTRGQSAYREGDEAENFYIIRSGQFKIIKTIDKPYPDDNKMMNKNERHLKKMHAIKIPVELGILTPAEIFGEDELFYETKRKFSIICESAIAQVYEMDKKMFTSKIIKETQVQEWLRDFIQSRNKYLNQRIKQMTTYKKQREEKELNPLDRIDLAQEKPKAIYVPPNKTFNKESVLNLVVTRPAQHLPTDMKSRRSVDKKILESVDFSIPMNGEIILDAWKNSITPRSPLPLVTGDRSLMKNLDTPTDSISMYRVLNSTNTNLMQDLDQKFIEKRKHLSLVMNKMMSTSSNFTPMSINSVRKSNETPTTSTTTKTSKFMTKSITTQNWRNLKPIKPLTSIIPSKSNNIFADSARSGKWAKQKIEEFVKLNTEPDYIEPKFYLGKELKDRLGDDDSTDQKRKSVIRGSSYQNFKQFYMSKASFFESDQSKISNVKDQSKSSFNRGTFNPNTDVFM